MLRIGVVGAGIIGDAHKKAIEKSSDSCMAAVCDLDIEKAKALADGTDARVYTDYKEMQEKEELDGVILNLPHFLHKDVSIYFLDHKVPVLVEKPMANSVEECDAMIEASKRNNTPLAVGHVQKYFEPFRYLREVVESGRLGKFCSMTETRNIDYFTNRPNWFLNKAQAGGGIMHNYGAHALDRLFYVTGTEVNYVAARGGNILNDCDIEASAQVLLGLSGGASAALSYCACKGPYQFYTNFYFTNGAAKVCDSNTSLWITEGKNGFEKIELPEQEHVFVRQFAEFEKLIKGEKSEIVTPEFGRRVIAVLEEAYDRMQDK